ncbi:hypothetical protein BDV95DRAFT_589592 [Massariosphaeria phaeospora]|uniref:Uncharacterized protein n=1 Tax=Massariosphaeria phaeospora TaxID=100035 RepID=A0A7C8MME1_9PLEO|nr:hypothetical protein BDV95DRAFT_589592 [Massariosphaeria phaeospora]
MAPTPPHQKRYTACSYYSTSCTGHRTAAIVIVVAIVSLILAVAALFVYRHYQRKAAATAAARPSPSLNQHPNMQSQALGHTENAVYRGRMIDEEKAVGSRGFRGFGDDPPPVYTPRRPEPAVSAEVVR